MFLKVAQIVATSVYTYISFSKYLAQKVTNYFGHLYKQIWWQERSKVAQSGHTARAAPAAGQDQWSANWHLDHSLSLSLMQRRQIVELQNCGWFSANKASFEVAERKQEQLTDFGLTYFSDRERYFYNVPTDRLRWRGRPKNKLKRFVWNVAGCYEAS